MSPAGTDSEYETPHVLLSTRKEFTLPMRRRFYATFGLLIILTLVGTVASLQANLSKGDKAPDFKLTRLDGKTTSLADLQKGPKGAKRIVVLNFWATWCPHCRVEAPYLQKLSDKYGKKGLVVVGVSLDSDGAKSVKPFAKSNKLSYTNLLDPKHEVARKYTVGPIPTTYIIDRKGVIRSVTLGFAPGMEKGLEEDVKGLLK